MIRLENVAAKLGKMVAANPDAIPGKPVVYVGMTSKTPEERFSQHKAGGRLASSIVTKFGRRLFPWAYQGRRTYRRKESAEKAEVALAEELRRRGWVVWQN